MNLLKTLAILVSFSAVISCKKAAEKTISRDDSIFLYRKSAALSNKRYYDSIKTAEKWQKTSYGLWKNQYGDLAIETSWATEEGVTGTYFIKEIDTIPLKNIVDTATFRYLGSSFYKDKNRVYTLYAMAHGGSFWDIKEADAKTFRVMSGDCYAKDKNHIYGERQIPMDSVDYATFRTAEDCNCYAKDKNDYYYWARKISEEDIDPEILKKLKKL